MYGVSFLFIFVDMDDNGGRMWDMDIVYKSGMYVVFDVYRDARGVSVGIVI